MTTFWLARHFIGSWRRFFDLSMTLSVFGLAIGVASLVVSMAVVSGYQTTLTKTIQNVVGHLLIYKRGVGNKEEVLSELKPEISGFVAATPFVYVDAILAHRGQLNGVMIEGVDLDSVNTVLDLNGRIMSGTADLGEAVGSSEKEDEFPGALVGKGIAEKFKINLGDVIRIVVPMSNELDSTGFKPKVVKFKVTGIMNYGRADFDSRYVVVSIKSAQGLAEVGDRITGFRVKIEKPETTPEVAAHISRHFKDQYVVRDWVDVNRNLFEAVRLEKIVLFFILLILIVVACFNVSSTLYMSVVQRYRDISVLKAMGASDRFVRRLFTLLGLMVGLVGAVVGIGLGLLACFAFEMAQVHLGIIPKEVYKLDHISLDVRVFDLVLIIVVTQVICFVATLIPARRGAKIVPVEGLRYE